MDNKKVVVIGGGTGMSVLLKGLKKYPLDITAVVTVSDDGKSTGRLRKEFNTVAVGDIRRVLIALSNTEPLMAELLNYRFETTSELNGHPVGNLLLTAMTNITGNMSVGLESLSKVLKLRGNVFPVTESNVTLVGKMEDGTIIEGEHYITKNKKKIKNISYKDKALVNERVSLAIKEADMIVLSMGSIYTSIIANLVCDGLVKAIDESKAKLVYVCNMMSQPGETDHFAVSDHVNLLNKYLGKRKLDIVIANNGLVNESIIEKYETTECKDLIILDEDNIDITVIKDDLVNLEDNVLRHNVERLSYDIFSILYK